MTESYEVAGVLVTPQGGGYYELSHSSMETTEKVRGKEAADARATEIGQANPLISDSSLPPQGGLDDGPGDAKNGGATPPSDITSSASLSGSADDKPQPSPKPSTEAQQAASAASPVGTPNLNPEPEAGEDPRDAQIRVLQEQMKQMLTALQSVTTVQTSAPSPADAVPLDAPREFVGQMSKAHKAAYKKAGIEVVTISLEENESIPPTGLFIGHNGRSFMIKPGEEVDVPDFLLNVLDDAVMSAPIVDPGSQKVLGYRNRSKYPYRRISN